MYYVRFWAKSYLTGLSVSRRRDAWQHQALHHTGFLVDVHRLSLKKYEGEANLTSTEKGRRKTMKWEYRTVDWGEIRKIGSRITGEDFIDANVDAGLNALGQEGWELVSVYVDGFAMHRSNKGEELLASSRYVKYTFKRPLGE
jgi:hypothetical protein